MKKVEKLSLKVKMGYGAGDIGGNLFFTVVGFWLMNYLTDEVKLSAGLAGIALMIGKFWDAFTDPTVGFLSDKTRTRWGRRRPFFLFAAIPMGISFFIMFTNPQIENQLSLFIWATLVYMLICTVYTCINIPYNSMTPELTKDFNERTTLNGYRMSFAVVGTLLGAGAALPIVHAFDDSRTGFMVMGAVFGAIMTISALIPFFTLREPIHPEAQKTKSIFKTYLVAFKNRPFVLILLAWLITGMGMTMIDATIIYYFKYVFKNEEAITPALIVLLVTLLLFIPLWVKVAEGIGKKWCYILGFIIVSIVLLIIFLVGHHLSIEVAYIFMFFAGIGFSALYVMPWSIIPDTVEYDYAQSGKRQEGIYYSIWTFALKFGQALAGFMVGVVLELFGYIAEAEQSETALFGIRLLIGPIPIFFIILGIVLLLYYPIDKQYYEQIQLKIKEMEKKIPERF